MIADMQVAGGRLAKLLTDKPTQQKQQDAVDKLNALIKLLEERRRQRRPGRREPQTGRPKSRRSACGPGGSGPLHDAHRNGNAWGQLPAHKREQILQSMTEGFPAHYQQILGALLPPPGRGTPSRRNIGGRRAARRAGNQAHRSDGQRRGRKRPLHET